MSVPPTGDPPETTGSAPLTLRDRLALRRTALANERTLLAYLRTALMLVASGATLWKLEPLGAADRALGSVALLAGGCVALLGAVRFAKATRSLDAAGSERG